MTFDRGVPRISCSGHGGPTLVLSPLALALAKTDMWEGHAGQTQANPVGFGIHLDYSTCLHVTVLFGIPGICRADRYMRAAREL